MPRLADDEPERVVPFEANGLWRMGSGVRAEKESPFKSRAFVASLSQTSVDRI